MPKGETYFSDYQSFDAEILALRKRAEELWVSKSEDATWLVGELFRSTLNPLGEETLAALIAGMEPEAARRITSRQIQFLPALFQAKPSLATSFQLWLAGGDRKRELFEALASRKDLDPTLIAGIVRALLESNSDGFIRRALDLWGRLKRGQRGLFLSSSQSHVLLRRFRQKYHSVTLQCGFVLLDICRRTERTVIGHMFPRSCSLWHSTMRRLPPSNWSPSHSNMSIKRLGTNG